MSVHKPLAPSRSLEHQGGGAAVSIQAIVLAGYSFFWGLTKEKLIDVILSLRDEYTKAQAQIRQLKDDIAKLKEELKQHKINGVNRAANKPSSKQAEWEAKGSGTDQNTEDKKKKKKRTTKPRAGAGNKAKQRTPDRTETATVDDCELCGKDLRDKEPLKSSNERLIEDIPDPVEETEVVKIIQEKKYCDDCKAVITAKSELALPGADIGLNASVLVCYLWVALCLPYTKIKDTII